MSWLFSIRRCQPPCRAARTRRETCGFNVLSASSRAEHAAHWESLMYLQGLGGTDVQFFTLPRLQFSLSNGVKHVSELTSGEKQLLFPTVLPGCRVAKQQNH